MENLVLSRIVPDILLTYWTDILLTYWTDILLTYWSTWLKLCLEEWKVLYFLTLISTIVQ